MNRNKILVVDDEQGIRDICKRALEWAGYRVDVSQNAQEALKLLDKEDYELVLTDLNMPGLNGLELIREIKKKHPRCKTLLMTGFFLGNNNIDTRNYLHKPFRLRKLFLKIKQSLSSP